MKEVQEYSSIFVDDSGNTGFKQNTGMSNYFLIAAVLVKNYTTIIDIEHKMNDLRERLNWRETREFKSHSISKTERVAFLKMLKDCDFVAYVGVVDRTKIKPMKPRTLYNETILKTIRLHNIDGNVGISIDGEAGNSYKREAKTYFRKNMRDIKIVAFDYKDSKKSNMIQIADIIVGTAHDYLKKNINDENFQKLIRLDKIKLVNLY